MMKKFLLVVCGSFVGVTLALIVFTISSIVGTFALMSMGDKGSKSVSVSKNSILHLDLTGTLEERDGGAEMEMMTMVQGGELPKTYSLAMLQSALKEAAANDNIKGLLIDCNGMMSAPASREVLRLELQAFKNSGKFIYAYGQEGISQGDYYLVSLADSIFLNPQGGIDVHGLGAVLPYYKRALDKLGVKMQVLRVGTFKSAVEPYMLDSISPANRLQTEHYLGAIWGEMRDSIAKSRHIGSDELNEIANGLVATYSADSLMTLHFVDKLCHREDLINSLKAQLGVKKKDDLSLVEPEEIAKPQDETASGDHIAVLYAVGEILDGDGNANQDIYSEPMVAQIQKLRDDENVKGMVLRVNSPGGSAFASEEIWHALEEFKAAGKPLAVSMGDYAASGGYYISSGADRIFAERTTITGSIGIFGMIPSLEDVVTDKVGVTLSSVKTNTNADFGTIMKSLTPAQTASLQNMINRGYELFTSRCAQGRHVSQDSIKTIAEGRVWDGITAKQIGLVDEFGGLAAATKWVAKKAGLKEDCATQNYPSIETDWRTMLRTAMQASYEARMRKEFGVLYDYHCELTRILQRSHMLCLMPEVEIN